MDLNLRNNIESFQEGTKETADFVHEKTNEFHKNYVSKVVPDFGKYGDAAKFTAEMLPGVAEYNAINEGDWTAFAIAAGIDIGALAIGAFTAGTGYAAVKGGTAAAKVGVKVATKEVAEAGAKKVAKEAAETGIKKAAKEAAETGVEKAVKETAETGVEKAVIETVEAGVEKGAKEVAETGIEKAERAALKVGEKIDKTRFPEYIDEVEKITKREIPQNQKELIEKALKENDFKKLSPEDTLSSKREFNRIKDGLIKEWEEQTGQSWPRYTEDVLNEAGEVIRKAGQPFDAHHLIEVTTSGPHEWWNIHPARFPGEHQNGIHAAESLASKIFG